MIRFWRLDDVPELRGLPTHRQRTLWSEATTRSNTPRWLLLQMVARIAGTVAVLALLWVKPDWLGTALALSGVLLVQLVVDGLVIAPKTRQWLHEHAHELDRYVPA
ncbi:MULTISPECIES: hypothetical protein [unclassified Rhodanobacter]|uniref:Uncharacterized protein n=1 Tax=Rhodanobacter humi TaxID=1888173 RepID=A0ABV4AMV9_9GAMM